MSKQNETPNKPLNAYWIYTKDLPSYEPVYHTGDYVGSARVDDVVYAHIVIAESRGQAKSQFVACVNGFWGNGTVEYLDIESVRVLAKGVDYPIGVIEDCPYPPSKHPLWTLVAGRFWSGFDTEGHEVQS
jgi:hypothetical protein